MKILSLRTDTHAVNSYRLTRLLTPLKALFIERFLEENKEANIGTLAKAWKKKADIWVTKYVRSINAAKVILSMRNIGGAKVITDVDDNIWEIPVHNPASQAWGIDKIANYTLFLMECDGVVVSTETLKKIVERFNTKVAVIPNGIIASEWEEWKSKRKKHEKVRIGWIYSDTHTKDGGVAMKALERISDKYCVEVILFGGTQNPFPKSIAVKHVKSVHHDEYIKTLTGLSLDISIAPLAKTSFNRSKSNIKWLESTMAGAAFVGQNMEAYKSVEHGVTGFLASTEQEWFDAIEKLLDADVRNEMVMNAKKEVEGNWTAEKFSKKYEDFLLSLMA